MSFPAAAAAAQQQSRLIHFNAQEEAREEAASKEEEEAEVEAEVAEVSMHLCKQRPSSPGRYNKLCAPPSDFRTETFMHFNGTRPGGQAGTGQTGTGQRITISHAR